MAEFVMLLPTIEIVHAGSAPDWTEPKPFTTIVAPDRNCDPAMTISHFGSAVLKLARFTVSATL